MGGKEVVDLEGRDRCAARAPSGVAERCVGGDRRKGGHRRTSAEEGGKASATLFASFRGGNRGVRGGDGGWKADADVAAPCATWRCGFLLSDPRAFAPFLGRRRSHSVTLPGIASASSEPAPTREPTRPLRPFPSSLPLAPRPRRRSFASPLTLVRPPSRAFPFAACERAPFRRPRAGWPRPPSPLCSRPGPRGRLRPRRRRAPARAASRAVPARRRPRLAPLRAPGRCAAAPRSRAGARARGERGAREQRLPWPRPRPRSRRGLRAPRPSRASPGPCPRPPLLACSAPSCSGRTRRARSPSARPGAASPGRRRTPGRGPRAGRRSRPPRPPPPRPPLLSPSRTRLDSATRAPRRRPRRASAARAPPCPRVASALRARRRRPRPLPWAAAARRALCAPSPRALWLPALGSALALPPSPPSRAFRRRPAVGSARWPAAATR